MNSGEKRFKKNKLANRSLNPGAFCLFLYRDGETKESSSPLRYLKQKKSPGVEVAMCFDVKVMSSSYSDIREEENTF